MLFLIISFGLDRAAFSWNIHYAGSFKKLSCFTAFAGSLPWGLLFSHRLDYMLPSMVIWGPSKKQKWKLQGLLRLGSWTHIVWLPWVLLVRASHKTSPDCRWGEIESTFWWEEWQSHCIEAWKDLSPPYLKTVYHIIILNSAVLLLSVLEKLFHKNRHAQGCSLQIVYNSQKSKM